jgi:hypothetical protein
MSQRITPSASEIAIQSQVRSILSPPVLIQVVPEELNYGRPLMGQVSISSPGLPMGSDDRRLPIWDQDSIQFVEEVDSLLCIKVLKKVGAVNL